MKKYIFFLLIAALTALKTQAQQDTVLIHHQAMMIASILKTDIQKAKQIRSTLLSDQKEISLAAKNVLRKGGKQQLMNLLSNREDRIKALLTTEQRKRLQQHEQEILLTLSRVQENQFAKNQAKLQKPLKGAKLKSFTAVAAQ